MCARTLSPLSSCTRNIAFGSGSITVPSKVSASSLAIRPRSPLDCVYQALKDLLLCPQPLDPPQNPLRLIKGQHRGGLGVVGRLPILYCLRPVVCPLFQLRPTEVADPVDLG